MTQAAAASRVPMSDDQVGTATRLCRALVSHKQGLFHFYRDLDGDDLTQEMLEAVLRAWPRYDAKLSGFPHWVWMVGERELFKVGRDRGRLARRDTLLASLLPDPDQGAGADGLREVVAVLDAGAAPTPILTADWLASIYKAVKYTLGATSRHRQGRHFFNIAQVMAVGFLMTRCDLSVRAARIRFLDADDSNGHDLARAVRFLHVPGVGWFQSVPELCADVCSRFRAPQKAALTALLEYPLSDDCHGRLLTRWAVA